MDQQLQLVWNEVLEIDSHIIYTSHTLTKQINNPFLQPIRPKNNNNQKTRTGNNKKHI
jgi:hypothetical protein